MTADAPVHEPPTIVIPSPQDGSPQILLGFAAFGSEIDIQKLETAARAEGFGAGRPKTDDGRIELMVLFDSKTTREHAFGFMGRVQRGEFGAFETGTMIVPPSAIKKAK
jgi:hypothetical protein